MRAINGIATETVDHTRYGKDRAAFERALHDILLAHRIELVCLAGFMRVLTPWLVGLWERPDAEHPPFPASGLQRSAHA